MTLLSARGPLGPGQTGLPTLAHRVGRGRRTTCLNLVQQNRRRKRPSLAGVQRGELTADGSGYGCLPPSAVEQDRGGDLLEVHRR